MTTRAHSRLAFLDRFRRSAVPRSSFRAPRSHSVEALEARIAPAAILNATKVAVFAAGGDVNGDGKFQPGDTILYTVTISNGGDVDLTGVTFNDIIDPNTNLGAVNVGPLALNDSFTAVANTLLEVGVTHGSSPAAQVSGSVVSNDVEFLGDTFTLKTLQSTNFSGGTATATSGQGGTVTMNASGNFTYLPAAGFTGSDTFTYTITDKGLDGVAGNADDLTSQGTVSVTVGAQKVWYVDNSYTGANGASDGRSTRPFTSITATNLNGPAGVGDVDGVGDIIFVHTGTGSAYTGGIALEGNQTLQGQGNALTVGGFNLVAAGTAPTLTNAAGTVVALSNAASNVNTLRGFTAGTSTTAISGTSFGTLEVSNVTINNPSGAGLNLTTGAFASGSSFNNITSGGGVNGIALTGVTGTGLIGLGGGALSGASGAEFLVSGGSAQLLYSGTITNTAGRSVDISTHATGNITLSGSLSDTGTGVSITNNTSGTIAFTGTNKTINTGTNPAVTYTGNGASFQFIGGNLDIDTTSGAGINATGNTGAFNVTGTNNTINTTTGTPLTVSNSVIGTLGLTFASITGTGAAANGIVLLNTGASGAFTVTGATNLGTAAGTGPTGTAISIVNHDGGISFGTVDIQRRGSTGIFLDDITGGTATFGATTIPNQTGAGGYGIRVEDSSADVTFASATISNTVQTDATDDANSDGIPDDEGNGDAIFLIRNSGFFRLNGGSLTNLAADGIDMRASSGDLRVTGVLIQGIGLTSASGVNVDDTGISVRDLQGNLVVRNTQIQNFHGQNDGGGNEHGVWVVQTNTSFGTIELDNVDLDNDAVTGVEGGNGFEIRTTGTVNGNVKIHNGSSFTDLSGEGVDFQLNSAGTLNIEIANSTFGPSIQDPIPGDGTILAALNGISWAQFGSGTVFMNIHDSTITDTHTANANAGMITGTAQGSSKLIARIANNIIDGDALQNLTGRAGIYITAGNTGVASDAPTQFDVDITGNTINETDDDGITIDVRGSAMHNATANVSVTNNIMGNVNPVAERAHFEGMRLRVRDSESTKTVNFLFQGNTLINAGNSVGDETLDMKVESANNTLNATVVSNTITNTDTGTSPAVAFRAQSGFSGTTQGGTLNLDVRLNTFNTVSGSETADYELFENVGQVFVEGAGTGTVTPANLQAQNTAGVARVVGAVTFNNGVNVTMPTNPAQPTIPSVPLMFAPSAGDVVAPVDPGAGSAPTGGDTTQTGSGSTAPGGGSVIVDDGVLSQAELESLVSAAKARWIATGLSAAQIALLDSVTFSVADLPGWYLGSAAAGHITLDSNAAGNSWFIDATPLDDSEFSGAGTQLAANSGLAAGRIDALTTVMHELGHQLGVDDSYDAADRADLMYGFIHQSERRLPGAGQAEGAVPDTLSGAPDFAVGPINIGSLPIGKSVQVVFTAQIVANPNASTISNQGTANSTQTGPVLTDDPGVAGTTNPTVTQIALPEVNLAIGTTTSVAEDSGGNLVYTFTRQAPLTNSLTVNFTVSGGAVFTGNGSTDTDYTVAAAASFTGTTGTVTFAPNSNTAVVTITPRADTTTENDETVVLTLASGTGYSVAATGSISGSGTITNDDTTVFVQGTPGSVAEDSGSPLTYTFKRAGVTANALTVNFNIAGSAIFTGNAAADTDYTQSGAATFSGTTGTFTFAPGSDTATITLTPKADSTVEPDETAQLSIAPGAGYNVNSELSSLTGTITNDDATVSVAITPPGSIAEDAAAGQFLTYTFTRAGFIANAVTVNFTASGSATKDVDYVASGASFIGLAGTVTFAPNSTTAIVTVDPTADANGEPDETVIFTINAGTGYTAATSPSDTATGTILNDDTSVSVAVTGSPVAENAPGGTVLTYTFTRSGDNTTPLTINFSAGGSASFANDYTLTGAASFSTATGLGTVTFAAGSSTATITAAPNNDTLVEGTEDALIFVNTGPGYGVGASPAFGQITDNETATVSFEFTASNAPEATTPHTVGVKLVTFSPEGTASLQNDFTVFVQDTTVPGVGVATGGGVDYTFNQQSLTFSAGDTGSTKTVSAAIVNDTISEGNETFRLGLSPNSGVIDALIAHGFVTPPSVTIDPTPHTVTIVDNDIDLQVTAAGPSQPAVAGSGNGNVTFTITVENTGLTDATNIDLDGLFTIPTGVSFFSGTPSTGTLTPTGPSSGTWNIPALAINGTATLTLSFTAGPSTANNASVGISGSAVSADQTLTNTEDDSDEASASVIRQSDLALTKSDSPDPVGPGAQLTYTIVVSNTGPSDNTSATIMDIFPAGYSNVTWTAAVTGSPNPLSGTGNIESTVSIPAGGTATYTVTGTVTAPSNTSLTNTANLISSEDTNGENNSDSETTFIGGVDLKLTKAADVAQAAPGTVIKYTLTYRNGGFITANGTSISDLIPANTVFDLANSTAGWQNMLGTALADGAAAGTPASFPIGSLPVSETGAIAILAVRVTATVSAGAGTIDNTAIIGDNGAAGADLVPSDNTAVASTTLVAAPDLVLSVVKNHYTNGGQDLNTAEGLNLIARGHEIRYTYTYSNAGNQDAINATLTAEVPTGTSFDSGNSTAGWSQSGPTTYVFFFQSLPAGAQASSVIFAVDINQSRITPLALKKVDSTATLDDGSVNGPDPTPANNTAVTSTTLYEGLYAVSPSRQGGAIGKGALPKVRVFDVTTGIEAESITAYERSYRDGVRIAIGDINGDGFDDIVTAAREGTTGKIRVFDGLTHARITVGESQEINAFTGRAARGAYIALGDINGDGRLDIIAGAGLGGGAVKVFSGLTGQQLDSDLTPFGANYRGGVRVASADVSGDGRADLIAGQGSMGSQVKVYFGTFTDGFAPRALNPDPLVFDASNGTAPRLRDGIFISTGDVTGDGIAEIIVGRGKMGNSTGASVGIFKLTAGAPALVPSFTATEIKTIPLEAGKTYKYGARVAATDINFDGIADIVVGAGHLGGSKVQILNGVTGNEISNFLAFPASPKIGVWTAAGAPPIPIKRIIIDA